MYENSLSRPARALWIEIVKSYAVQARKQKSRPARALWIEIFTRMENIQYGRSRPARALWIEIIKY